MIIFISVQRQLEEDRRKLKELRKAEQQQESLGIQTDPLSTQSTSVGSDTFTVTSTSTGSDDPSADQPKQKRKYSSVLFKNFILMVFMQKVENYLALNEFPT